MCTQMDELRHQEEASLCGGTQRYVQASTEDVKMCYGVSPIYFPPFFFDEFEIGMC